MEPFLFEAYEEIQYVEALLDGGQQRTWYGPVFRRRGDVSTVYYEMPTKFRKRHPPKLGYTKYCYVLRWITGTDPPVYKSDHELVIVKVFEFQMVQLHFYGNENPFREIEALRMIRQQDQHVVTVDAIMQDREGNIHVVMPLKSSEQNDALDEILCSQGRLEEDFARVLFRHLIHGLEYIHGLGLCHRDLCCENFVVADSESELSRPYGYIIDFGLAIRVKPNSPAIFLNHFPGKPCYMSPEVYDGQPFSQKTDVWSCGIILLNMLTGYLYQGGTYEYEGHPMDVATARSIFSSPHNVILGLETLLGGVPDLAADLIRSMIQRDSRARIPVAEIRQHVWLA